VPQRTLLILEDNPDRIAAMRAQAAANLPGTAVEVFDEVAPFIEWAETHLSDVSLISLDHDLDLISQPDGMLRDPGDGRQVARWLAGRAPVCPVIIHTTNVFAGESMRLALRDAGWVVVRVFPGPELSWIAADWLPAAREALADSRN
jgi:hypothetical protein